MTVFLQRLQQRFPQAPYQLKIEEKASWQFSNFLHKQNTEYFKPLIKDHVALGIEYSLLCTELAANFMREEASDSELTEQVAAALMFAEALAFIYQHYLAVPREVARLRRDQHFYRQLLRSRGYEFADLQETAAVKADKMAQKIRYATSQLNWLRMFLSRVKRVSDSLVPIIKSVAQYREWVVKINHYANPFFAYLSWLFFIPRQISNTLITSKHLIPSNWWMSRREQELEWYFRLFITIGRRWLEMGNDIPWVALGVVNCFILTGTLAPIGAYLTVGLFAYDVLLAGLRAYIELHRLYALREEYSVLAQKTTNPQEAKEWQRLQEGLHALISYEKKRMALCVFNATALFLAMALTIPALGFSPAFPLLAGVLLVLITILVYSTTKILEKKKPQDSVIHLEKETSVNVPGLRFFNAKANNSAIIEDHDEEDNGLHVSAYA